MLTEKAAHERMWGWIPELGKLLGSKKISAHASRSNGIKRDALNMMMKADGDTIANTIQFLQHHPFG